VLNGYEITKTYNGQEVTQISSTKSSLLGGASFTPNESVNLGYTLVNNEVANYWTGIYYLQDLDTGEKFTNSLKWNNSLTPYSVIATDTTENKIDVSNVTELRAALTTAASDGKDTIIYLADGNYTTTEDGLGQFQYSTSQNYSLTIKGSSRENVILSGENITRVLYLSGGKEFHLENITIEKGYIDGNGGGVWTNKDLYLDSSDIINNNTDSAATNDNKFINSGGGLYSTGNLYINNSVIGYNSSGGKGGGFDANFLKNVEIKNSIIIGNESVYWGSSSGFYADYVQVYNSIIDSNDGGAFYTFGSFSLVNSLIINNEGGIESYSKDSYIVTDVTII